MVKIFVGAIAIAVLVYCAAAEVDLQEVLTQIPEKERVDFLRYHAMKGYELDSSSQAVDNERSLPDQFSIDVYRTLLKKAVDPLPSPLACIVCWPNGKCVDLCDPGIHPL